MKKLVYFFAIGFLLISFSSSALCGQTPYTVSMGAGANNATAFGADGTVGSDGLGIVFYVHWDANYIYVGWSGGKTNYSSDLYYIAFDTDPDGTNGTTNGIEDIGFIAGGSKPDYYTVYENNSAFYGAPASNGNAFELYSVSGGNWSWVSRTDGDNGVSSQIDFQDSNSEVRLRIAWSALGITPGSSQKLGIVMWNNNSSGNYMWARYPTSNPSNGSTPKTLTHYLKYNSTGDGVTPSSDYEVAALPVQLVNFTASSFRNFATLRWSTASEVDNFGFDIERREVGKNNWAKVGFVAGSGNSTSKKDYTFTDNSIKSGSFAYRLKQINRDGSFEYSGAVEVELGVAEKRLTLDQNYPNPFNQTTNVDFTVPENGHATLKVYNLVGQEVAVLFNGNAEVGKIQHTVFNASSLPSGLYCAKLQFAGTQLVKQMMVVK